jgi:hypothetical protein
MAPKLCLGLRPSDNFARRARARWVFLWVIQLHKRVIPEWAKRLARKGFRTKYTHPDEYSSYLDENLSEIEKYETQLKGRDFPQHAAKAAHYATGSDLVTIFKIGED